MCTGRNGMAQGGIYTRAGAQTTELMWTHVNKESKQQKDLFWKHLLISILQVPDRNFPWHTGCFSADWNASRRDSTHLLNSDDSNTSLLTASTIIQVRPKAPVSSRAGSSCTCWSRVSQLKLVRPAAEPHSSFQQVWFCQIKSFQEDTEKSWTRMQHERSPSTN